MIFQFATACPAHEVEGEHFKGMFCRFSAGPKGNEHACDQCAVNLNGQPVEGLSQEVLTA